MGGKAWQRMHGVETLLTPSFGLLLLAGLLGMVTGPRPVTASDRVLVAASIAPLADFVRQVGGERVEVLTLVPPGASPHTYELKPSGVMRVARARLLVVNGAGLEYWADKLVKAAANPDLALVDTSRGIPLIDEGRTGANPHVWLDVRQAIRQVDRIRDALARTDPQHQAEYERNAARFTAELESLDREIAADIAQWRERQFIAFHPAWVYFARRYGLRQTAVIERFPGREASPAELARVIDSARRIGARAIFAEHQFSAKTAETIAEESGARVVVLDPLGSSLEDGGYIALMRHNVRRMREVLR